jgi:hypothetical protein
VTDHDDFLKDLDAALRVEPSPAFAGGVLHKVGRAHDRNRNMWLGLAAAAAISLTTVALWRPADEPVAIVTAHNAAPSAPPSASPTPVGTNHGFVVLAKTPRSARRVAPLTTTSSAPSGASEPRLEVFSNQGAVLRALWADARGQQLPVINASEAAVLPAVAAIEVNPIVVPPIVVAELGKEPGPAGATPIIRRAGATKETR